MLLRHRQPTHPGEILLHEFLVPLELSQVGLAEKLDIPIQRINTLIKGKRGVPAETAILLSRALGTSPEFWMNLQAAHDLFQARQRLEVA